MLKFLRKYMVRLAGVEPAAPRLGGGISHAFTPKFKGATNSAGRAAASVTILAGIYCAPPAFAQTNAVTLALPHGGSITLSIKVDAYTPGTTDPTDPTINPNLFLASGQSNMANIMQYGFFTAQGLTVYGFARGAESIACWAPQGDCWAQLLPQITGRTTAKAFVWFQGESDNIAGVYAGLTDAQITSSYVAAARDVFTRVRLAVGNPYLPIYLTKVSGTYVVPGTARTFTAINAALVQLAGSLAHVRLIDTSDPGWWAGDNLHVNNLGATNIVAAYKSQ